LTIKPGGKQRFICYTYERAVKDKYYGYVDLFDWLNTDYMRIPAESRSAESVKELDFRFIKGLIEGDGEKRLSNMGLLPGGVHRPGDKNSVFEYRKADRFEIGWCGQNITVAEMLIRDYAENGDKASLDTGLKMIETWLGRRYPSGLYCCHYDVPADGTERIDACNEGWFIYKLAVICGLTKALGIENPAYAAAIRSVCDYYCAAFPHGAFPQIIKPDGEIVIKDGCAGTIMAAGFLEAYRLTGDRAYLERAISAYGFYYEYYMARSVAAGGALDTYCVDKESAGPLLRAALLLHEITREEKYMKQAVLTAHYLMTWCFYHDVRFDRNSDCKRSEIRTTGGTAVSAAHHHIDCWGVFYAPDFFRLYELTGAEVYLLHAKALWAFAVQNISDGTLTIHGMTRPAGGQNECVLQCNWHGPDETRGGLNDWLVAWVKTFQLDAYYAGCLNKK
jgi:hypothetical protein